MRALSARLPGGGRCLVCVSGGGDSMCLLHAMHRASEAGGFSLEVVHVNHLVRGQAALDDYELVRIECARLGVPCHYRETRPLSVKPRGKTTEEYLREQRHMAVDDVARACGIATVAVGHTADDLAETFLMHLLRGAGLRGLSFRFSQRRGDIRVIRPLWQTPRQRILAYLETHDVPFHEDETNKSTEFTRNRVRHLLIPFVEREFNPAVRKALRRTTQILGEAHRHIRARARFHLRAMLRATAEPASLPIRRLRRLPDIVAVEVIHQWLVGLRGEGARPSFEHCQSVLRLARSTKARRVRLAGGTTIARSEQMLVALAVRGMPDDAGDGGTVDDHIAHEELARRYAVQHPELPLVRLSGALPVTARDEQGRLVARLTTLDGRRLTLRLGLFSQSLLPLDADGVPADEPPLPLVLRNRQPGDRISPSVRLKSVLINDKVPYYIRDYLVLVTDARRRLLAVVGMDRITARIQTPGAAGLVLDTDLRVPPGGGSHP